MSKTSGCSGVPPNADLVPVLSISGTDEDYSTLRGIFGLSNWELHQARNRREALEFLRDHDVPVVICERDLPDGDWKDLLGETAMRDRGPALIVAARAADDRLWAEVLNLGGCDVLAKPYDAKEVLWSVDMAWNDWKARLEQPALTT